MVTNEVPGVTVGYATVLSVAAAAGGIVLLLGRLALRAQRQRPATGAEAMVGEIGRALVAFTAEGDGQIAVHGEIWRARSQVPLTAGAAVRVVAIHGLTLQVEPERSLDRGETT
jgi:membrane-bound serine protease (ClpP class)